MKLSQELIDKLVKLASGAKPRNQCEDFIPYDWFGGNMDDAYWGGVEDGEQSLSREILDELNIPYKKEEE